MDEGCVKCHGILGYKAGDMRGATGVNLPLASYYARIAAAGQQLIFSHLGIWLIGMIGIFWAGREGYLREAERKNAQTHIHYLAHHDSLTGLSNRYSMESRLRQAMAMARRHSTLLAMFFIDLDQFKVVNDSLGHHFGDRLLVEVARRLTLCSRESDIVARLGGDEFVIVLTEMEQRNDAIQMGNKIMNTLRQSCSIDGKSLYTSPSIGVSIFPDDGDDCDTLFKNADTAMYHAKAQGRNNLQFFTQELTQKALERMELQQDLRIALKERALELHYQPQIRGSDGAIVAFEALARWHHPRLGWVPPDQFIPLAEESGLMETLGKWVLDEACGQLAKWHAAGMTEIGMAVNISTQQLRTADLLNDVTETLAHHGIAASDLELEVTESVAMENPKEAIARLEALQKLGLTISIDDFGTGYSSLAYLKMLPVKILKLDRTFVKDIEVDANDAAISRSTLALAHGLGLEVVAEGVETAAQRDFLLTHGCEFMQGYFFGKPENGQVWQERMQAQKNPASLAV
ncbi:MAG: EAL domain-containing protein [Gammaproteobacteria bacterium]|nr:EAL domain-containing protein [Gammaproteobacteria bacterium]